MGTRERAIIYAAIIAAVGAVLAAFISVAVPKLLPLQATNSTSISVGGQSQIPVPPTQPPNCNGADTCGQGTAVSHVITCENGVQHQSGTNGTETVTGQLPTGCTLVYWGLNAQFEGNPSWSDGQGGIAAFQGPAQVSGTIFDGEYQMIVNSGANSKYCDVLRMHEQHNWLHQHLNPLPGWSCP